MPPSNVWQVRGASGEQVEVWFRSSLAFQKACNIDTACSGCSAFAVTYVTLLDDVIISLTKMLCTAYRSMAAFRYSSIYLAWNLLSGPFT